MPILRHLRGFLSALPLTSTLLFAALRLIAEASENLPAADLSLSSPLILLPVFILPALGGLLP